MRYYSFESGEVTLSSAPTELVARDYVPKDRETMDATLGDTECLCSKGIGGCKATTSSRCFKDKEAECIRTLARYCNRG